MLHFLSYSFGIETTNTLIHNRSSFVNHTRFQTKMGKNPTLWGGTYLYGLYKGVSPGHVPIMFPRLFVSLSFDIIGRTLMLITVSILYKITKIERALWLAERSVCMTVCKQGCGVKMFCFSRANHASTNLKKFSSRLKFLQTSRVNFFFRLSWHFKR